MFHRTTLLMPFPTHIEVDLYAIILYNSPTLLSNPVTLGFIDIPRYLNSEAQFHPFHPARIVRAV